MAADYTIHRHAARRWAERVDKIPPKEVAEADMVRGQYAVALAMVTARCVVRYGGSKRRVFVSAAGVHLLVAPGSVVISTFDPEWIVPGCPCEGCLRRSAQELRDGVVHHRPHGQHGVLANRDGLKLGNHYRRHKQRRDQGGER